MHAKYEVFFSHGSKTKAKVNVDNRQATRFEIMIVVIFFLFSGEIYTI